MDSVLRNHFSGDMVSAKPRLISDFASGGGGVWGGILRLLIIFVLAEIGGYEKLQKLFQNFNSERPHEFAHGAFFYSKIAGLFGPVF